ncbi:MAG TPA: GatB/YqeY domain-containing protein [Polyangiaceae bacterium]|nr:GatB/YqeY domain-containing protein [Polyangiaceae bacterium]
MLVDDIKRRMFAAMKAKDTVEKEILRVALGEITGRGEATDDATVVAILKKLVKSNEESLVASTEAEQRQVLEREIAILQSLLPEGMSLDQIVEALGPVHDAIRAAKADGPATGIAMKHLKTQNVTVDGKDVAAAVRQIRSA